MEYSRICAHEHAGSTYVLGECEINGQHAFDILWQKPTTETSKLEAEMMAKQLALQFGCSNECVMLYTLEKHYAVGGNHGVN